MPGKEGRSGRRAVMPQGSKPVGLTLPPADYARVLHVVEARARRDVAARAADPYAGNPSLVVGAATPSCALRDVVYVGLAWGVLARAAQALIAAGADVLGAEVAADDLLDLLATLYVGQPLDVACPVEPGSLDALVRETTAPAERAKRREVGEQVMQEVLEADGGAPECALALAPATPPWLVDVLVVFLRDLMLEARAYGPEPGEDFGPELPVFHLNSEGR
jgi:hypothetical protein